MLNERLDFVVSCIEVSGLVQLIYRVVEQRAEHASVDHFLLSQLAHLVAVLLNILTRTNRVVYTRIEHLVLFPAIEAWVGNHLCDRRHAGKQTQLASVCFGGVPLPTPVLLRDGVEGAAIGVIPMTAVTTDLALRWLRAEKHQNGSL